MEKRIEAEFDNILFETREKSYGAYFLRKQYPKQLLFAFFCVSVLFSLAILIPFLLGNAMKKPPAKEQASLIEDLPPPPPPLQPSNEAIDYISSTEMYCGESKVVTLILEKDHKISWWFRDCEKDSIKTTDYSEQGLRKVLAYHLHLKPWLPMCSDSSVAKDAWGAPLDKSKCWQPLFLIKPRHNAQYQDLIKVMNELLRLNIKSYTVCKFAKKDSLEMLGITMNIPIEPAPPVSIRKKRKNFR